MRSPARSIARCVTRTSGSDAATARVHTSDAADGSRLCLAPPKRLCDDSKLSQLQLHCPTHSKVSVWDNTPSATRSGSNLAVPNLPQMFLQTGLGRASTRQLSQLSLGGDWVLPRYSCLPHRPTPISVSDFRKFKPHTKISVSSWYPTHSFSLWETQRDGL